MAKRALKTLEELPSPPKMLVRSHSDFHEEEFTNPAGDVIRIRRVKSHAGTIYAVSVNGVRRDAFISLAKAKRKARELYHTLGTLV